MVDSIRVGSARVDFTANDSAYQRVVSRVMRRQNQLRRDHARVTASANRNTIANNSLIQSYGRIAVIAGAAGLLRAADSYVLFGNRIREATSTLEGYEAGAVKVAAIQQRLVQTANDTRNSLRGTVELYARVAQSAGPLGRSIEDIIQFTRSVNQAAQLGGATAIEAKNALIQLSQGIASNTLRGDELRSVLEQLPVVADVIAKELGVTRGGLRAVAEEGKISGEVVIRAFEKAATSLDERFNRIIPTVGQALTVLGTQFIDIFGGGSTGASGVAAQGIISVANNLDVVAAAALGVAGVFAGRYVASQATAIAASAQLARQEIITLQIIENAAARRATLAAREATRLAAVAPARGFGRLAQAEAETAARRRATIATNAQVVAQRNLARATTLAGRASRVAAGALAFLGGPIGAIVTGLTLAASAWLLFRDNATEASISVADIVQNVEDSVSTLTTAGRAVEQLESRLAGLIELQQELVSQRVSRNPGIADALALNPEVIAGYESLSRQIDETVAGLARVREILAQQAGQASVDAVTKSFERLSLSIEEPGRLARDLARSISDGAIASRAAAREQISAARDSSLAGEQARAIDAARLRITLELSRVYRELSDATSDRERSALVAQQARDQLALQMAGTETYRVAQQQVKQAERLSIQTAERVTLLRGQADALREVVISEQQIAAAVREQREARAIEALEAQRTSRADPDRAVREVENFTRNLEQQLALAGKVG